jgi:hypothetical protein
MLCGFYHFQAIRDQVFLKWGRVDRGIRLAFRSTFFLCSENEL